MLYIYHYNVSLMLSRILAGRREFELNEYKIYTDRNNLKARLGCVDAMIDLMDILREV